MGIGLYGLTYLYPVYLGRVRGYSSLQIGETMFVTGAVHVPHGAHRRPAVAQARSAHHDGHRLSSASPPAPGSSPASPRTGISGSCSCRRSARRRPDALHGADQQHRARHPAAEPDQERVGPLQPDPQSRRRRRPRAHQHDPQQPHRSASPAPARDGDLGQRHRARAAGQPDPAVAGPRLRRRRRGPQGLVEDGADARRW